MQVIKNVIYKLQELQAEGKVHGHLTPAMVKVSDEGLVRVEGTHVIIFVPFARKLDLPVVQLAVILIESSGLLLWEAFRRSLSVFVSSYQSLIQSNPI